MGTGARKKKRRKKGKYPIEARKSKRGTSYRFRLPQEMGGKWVYLGNSWEGFEYKDAVRAYQTVMGKIAQRRFEVEEEVIGARFEDFAKAYLEDLKEHKGDIKREELYAKNLNAEFQDKLLNFIKPSDVKSYISKRLKEVSPTTVRKEFYFLQKLLKEAVKPEWAEISGLNEDFKNPCLGLKLPPKAPARTRVPNDDEIQKLLDNTKNEVIKGIILFAVYSGCRLGEILKLRDEQIDWEKEYIHWPKTKSGKSKALPLTKTIRKIVEEVPKPEDSSYIFCSPTLKKPYTLQGFETMFRELKKRAGLKDVRFHDLRRVFGTKLAELGYREKDIAELLGHSGTDATRVYIEISDERKKEAMEKVKLKGYV